eukprot:scaffold2193_cov74-Phaeocystis_antarctica.AAC.7
MQPDGTYRLSYSKFHVHEIVSSTPAAVQAARSEEMDSPPAEAHRSRQTLTAAHRGNSGGVGRGACRVSRGADVLPLGRAAVPGIEPQLADGVIGESTVCGGLAEHWRHSCEAAHAIPCRRGLPSTGPGGVGRPDGVCGLSETMFHSHAMESASPAAVQAARPEDMDSPPAEAHVPDCTSWYEYTSGGDDGVAGPVGGGVAGGCNGGYGGGEGAAGGGDANVRL